MIPINVTHTAIVTEEIRRKLLVHDTEDQVGTDEFSPLASTPLRHTISTIIGFFASSYKSTFGFNDGPPLHDALTIAYVCYPQIFSCSRYRVDVELHGTHSSGETVVDVWNYQSCDDSWGSSGKNCLVAESVDVSTRWILTLLLVVHATNRQLHFSTCYCNVYGDAINCRPSMLEMMYLLAVGHRISLVVNNTSHQVPK